MSSNKAFEIFPYILYFFSFILHFRLVLRCRADARKRFAAMRSDVLVKLELLDNKHVQDIVHQVREIFTQEVFTLRETILSASETDGEPDPVPP